MRYTPMMTARQIPDHADLGSQLTAVLRAGDVATLQRLLTADPTLATARIVTTTCGRAGARTLLHVLTDWPGHAPNGPEAVRVLIAAGTEVDAPFIGGHTETALHWAASCDDVDVLDALIDAGADLEAGGGVIGNGTPLADAVAFGQWNAARRLVARGAVANLWQAAALGLVDRTIALLTAPHTPDDVTNAFWCACHGGQRATAERLLAAGADPRWVGHDGLTPIEAARRSSAPDVVAWLEATLDG